MTERLVRISKNDAAAILHTAAAHYPAECCGLLEGTATSDGWRVVAVHEAPNIAPDPRRRFLIDPQHQFELLRRLRGTDRELIGCFHSHPDGPPQPSATDLAQAIEPDFVWLIASGTPASFELHAYLFNGATFAPLHLVQSS